MKKAIVGKKIGMTQIFTEDGRLVPVTVIKAGPCTVVQTKTVESDGYNAVQVGFGELTEKRAEKLLSKPVQGHYKKAGVEAKRVLREFLDFAPGAGYTVMGLDFSPVRGPEGNIEYLAYLKKGSYEAPIPDAAEIVAASHRELAK